MQQEENARCDNESHQGQPEPSHLQGQQPFRSGINYALHCPLLHFLVMQRKGDWVRPARTDYPAGLREGEHSWNGMAISFGHWIGAQWGWHEDGRGRVGRPLLAVINGPASVATLNGDGGVAPFQAFHPAVFARVVRPSIYSITRCTDSIRPVKRKASG